ncbi:MAG: tetratricopeptide repeat protein [Pseudomonadota bacterium]
MADIFDEVEEGLQQDRMTVLWRKYGWIAWLSAAILIGGVALNEYLGHQRGQAIAANTGQFEAGLDQLGEQDYVGAAETMTALVNADASISPVAAQYLAQVRLDGNGDVAAAREALLASIEGEADTAIEKLALIKAAYLQADDMTREDLQAFLGTLPDESSAFGALALELIAAKAMKEGDFAFARSEFNLIRVSANVPSGVARRADQALAAMPVVEVPEESEPEQSVEEEGAAVPEQEPQP